MRNFFFEKSVSAQAVKLKFGSNKFCRRIGNKLIKVLINFIYHVVSSMCFPTSYLLKNLKFNAQNNEFFY